MMMIDDEPSQDKNSKLIDILSYAFSEGSVAESLFAHFHRNSQPSLSYFQVDRHPDVDFLLQQLDDKDHVPWIQQHIEVSEMRHVQDSIKEEVVRQVYWNLAGSLGHIQKFSEAIDDFSFYNYLITAGPALVKSLCPQHLLFKLGNRQLLEKQMNNLWHQFSEWWKQGLSLYEVYKLIVRHKIDKDKYSFVTEYDIITLLNNYNECGGYCSSLYPWADQETDHEEEEQEQEQQQETNPIFDEIKQVIDKMGIFQIEKADDYIRLLIKISRGDAVTENEISANLYEPLFAGFPETVYTTDFQNSRWLPYLSERGLSHEDIILSFEFYLMTLSRNVIRLLQDHLPRVVDPLFELCDSESLKLSPEVCEIIQVAEIRRIALDSRFISQRHLIWAFYECGYGLPVNFWSETNIISDGGDYPPYHVYVASVKLAMLFGEKVVQLQHFVFAILRWDLIGDGEQVIEMEEDFRVYMEVLDSIKKTKAASEHITERDIEETGNGNISNKKRRIETTKPELRTRGEYDF